MNKQPCKPKDIGLVRLERNNGGLPLPKRFLLGILLTGVAVFARPFGGFGVALGALGLLLDLLWALIFGLGIYLIVTERT